MFSNCTKEATAKVHYRENPMLLLASILQNEYRAIFHEYCKFIFNAEVEFLYFRMCIIITLATEEILYCLKYLRDRKKFFFILRDSSFQ